MKNEPGIRLALQAEANFYNHLERSPYPGRGIVVGLDDTGENLIQVYWIMDRSENLRNRLFEHDGQGSVYTTAADPSKVKDPSLIIYNAMREFKDWDKKPMYAVSNGSQTDAVADLGRPHYKAMQGWQYKPDAPNFTPRITAVCGWTFGNDNPYAGMSVLRKSSWSDRCDRHFYEFSELGAGFGHCITTYVGDGDPLPLSRGEPLLMPLHGGIEEIADCYWTTLDRDNKVSLAVKFIQKGAPSQVHIINKYSKVA